MIKIKEFSILGKISIIYIIFLILIGILSPFLPLKSYTIPSGPALEAPSKDFILGTDDLGIDLFSQICNGARISLLIGFSTALLAGIGGGLIGMLAGYYGGVLDLIIMRIVDIMIALPELPMMILLGAFFGPSIKNIILVLALFSWVRPARIVRSKVISLKEEKYIYAARSYGAGFFHLARTHFLPEVFPIVSISVIRLVSKAVISEAGLSFIGLGDPTSKSWGIILNHALGFKGIYFTEYWKWWVTAPLAAIILLVLSISFISRDLEKILG